MKLKSVHIKEFHSILDAGSFEVEDITCLVGKNEAGKTALLKGLYMLNPFIPADANYNVTDDYPRWSVSDYKHAVEAGERKPAVVVSAQFELDQTEIDALVAIVGKKAINGTRLTASKGYDNKLNLSLEPFSHGVAYQHIFAKYTLLPELAGQLAKVGTAKEAVDALAKAEATDDVKKLQAELGQISPLGGINAYLCEKVLKPTFPQFLYFDEYYQMEGRANIEALKQRQASNQLLRSDYPLLGLINRARLKLDDLLNPNRTRELKNELEGAGNHLTKQIVKYWSQNRHLQLQFDVRAARPQDPTGMTSGTNIWSEVYDRKHRVTTELGSRSRGFVWFFSFLSWYGDVQRSKQPVILLLDEPGLTLHGKAQEDLLRYFESEIKGSHQLIYSTHSPFMVDARRFDRVRIVQDLSIDSDDDDEVAPEQEGTKVTTEVLEASKDSLFPLQGALGYEIYQTLFIGPNCLVVEGASDLLYLQSLSGVLAAASKTALSTDWTITPVGGSDKVPTFVALIGAQTKLKIAVLIDYQKGDKQKVENLFKKKLLDKQNVLTFAAFTATAEADIEDMFEIDFYLDLVNKEFKGHVPKAIKASDLPAGSRIVKRLEDYFTANPMKGGVQFNHYRPARYFASNSAALAPSISDKTLERFDAAFAQLNKLL